MDNTDDKELLGLSVLSDTLFRYVLARTSDVIPH